MSKRNKSYFGARKSHKCKKPHKRKRQHKITTLLTIDPKTNTYAIGFLDEPGPREVGQIVSHPETGGPIFIPFN